MLAGRPAARWRRGPRAGGPPTPNSPWRVISCPCVDPDVSFRAASSSAALHTSVAVRSSGSRASRGSSPVCCGWAAAGEAAQASSMHARAPDRQAWPLAIDLGSSRPEVAFRAGLRETRWSGQ